MEVKRRLEQVKKVGIPIQTFRGRVDGGLIHEEENFLGFLRGSPEYVFRCRLKISRTRC